ncbi:hypothetical protein SAMN05216241_10466 [Limimonas halophila]|uniref:Uncharacterized protein n=1 Tax=Limimonas halophila TaxID=1082479 RepID=A0A1G7QMJ9_9PROT|nr:hypothetical protein [Limimonas halophila]SDF99712.1 hypothetical protein SAMN05216241_10466 [Limimonas halophila]
MRKTLCVAGMMAGMALAPTAHAEVGDMVTTKTGCKTVKAFKTFEEVYKGDGRVAAYKALLDTGNCARLPEKVDVKLLEAVHSFDFGWGTGDVWRVKPVPDTKMTPKEFFIRIRDEK